MMAIRPEILPFLGVAVAIGVILVGVLRGVRVRTRSAVIAGGCVTALLAAYLVVFFRDPVRTPPSDPALVVAGAEGKVMAVTELEEKEFIKGPAVRISIFLSLVDVHVNRAPIAGKVEHARYYEGERFFTFEEKSSEFNQHSKIVIRGDRTTCLVKQIVGPIARRVVYWLEPGQALERGDSIGMMKFGSRLDMLFPRDDIEVLVRKGDKVRAGETAVARLRK
jgi:phosphatidylserine decarboxylase